MKRRTFTKNSAKVSLGLSLVPLTKSSFNGNKTILYTITKQEVREFLLKLLYTRQEVDDYFSDKAFPFSKHHPEFGWLLRDAYFRDGVNDSVSVYRYMQPDGERLMSNYAEKPCRFNTYGNSFTQCHQVSDHETWQEVLAGHLQEPIRNYGIGGWSVYQAYLRMLKEEERNPAEYIIFNIYEDDHKRNLDAWRNIRVKKHPQHIEATLPYLKVNLDDRTITECENPCPTPQSYYDLCDPDKAYKLFKDDFVLKIMVAHENAEVKNATESYEDLMDLIKTHGIKTKIDDSQTLAEEAEKIHIKAALFSTQKIVEKIEKFGQKNNKKVLYVLSYPGKTIAQYIEKKTRFDQSFIDYIKNKNLPYVDLMEIHDQDYKKYNLDIKEYINHYFIGHYNPTGNFFCAFALKDRLIEFVDPKPYPYKEE